MPIKRKTFEAGNFKKLNSNNYVLDFLKQNKDYAYIVDEMSKKLKKSKSSVRRLLQKLVKKGLVTKDVPYYIYKTRLIKVRKSRRKISKRVKR